MLGLVYSQQVRPVKLAHRYARCSYTYTSTDGVNTTLAGPTEADYGTASNAIETQPESYLPHQIKNYIYLPHMYRAHLTSISSPSLRTTQVTVIVSTAVIVVNKIGNNRVATMHFVSVETT